MVTFSNRKFGARHQEIKPYDSIESHFKLEGDLFSNVESGNERVKIFPCIST